MSMYTCVTDHTTSQRPGYSRTKLQSTPASNGKFVQQTRPTDSRTCYQQCRVISTILNFIAIEGYTCDDTAHSGIGVENIGAIARSEQGPLPLHTQRDQAYEFL